MTTLSKRVEASCLHIFFLHEAKYFCVILTLCFEKTFESARPPENFASLSLTWKKREFHDAPQRCGIHLLFLFHKSLLLRLLTRCGAAPATINAILKWNAKRIFHRYPSPPQKRRKPRVHPFSGHRRGFGVQGF